MATLPPPYLSLSFETVEARLWATDTIDNSFSDSTQVHLPSPTVCQKPLPPTPMESIYDTNCLLSGSRNSVDMTANNNNIRNTLPPLSRSPQRPRRHTTSLSSSSSSCTSVSSSSSSDQRHGYVYGSSPATYSPASSMSDCFSLLDNPDSEAPATDRHHNKKPQQSTDTFSTSSYPGPTPIPQQTLLSRRSTITKHLKRHWTLDESTSSSVRRLFTSEQLLKERKALGVWRNTLHGYLLDPAFKIPAPRHTFDSPRLAHCIVSELLATEETYLGHLSVLKQMFIDPFLQTFQNRYMIRDLQTIFSYIPSLITLSATLVRRWCMSIEQQTCYMDGKIVARDKKHDIGKTFCDLEDEFKVYTYYAVHYAKAQKCISRMEQKPSYQQWMHTVLQKKEIKRMGLSDYLISPIQRITRYCLLVKDLMKHTNGHDIELERALKYLTALAVAMNNCQQQQ